MYSIARLCASMSEGLSLLIWLHIVFRQRIILARKNVIFTLIYTLYYLAIDPLNSFVLENIVPLIGLIIFAVVSFGEKLFSTILRFLFSLIGISLVQLVSLELACLIGEYVYPMGLNGIYIVGAILTIFVSLIPYIFQNRKNMSLAKPDTFSVSVLIYMILIMLFIRLDYQHHNRVYSYLYIILYVLLILFVAVVMKELNVKHKLAQKQIELELRRQYEETYKKLIDEMRRKQHDYKNQIAALESMQTIAKDKEVLLVQKQEYSRSLLKRDRFDGILLSCENSVLAGYIYTSCIEIERNGIKISPVVAYEDADYCIPLHELIEILGILLNNAVEYLEESSLESKKIRLKVMGQGKKIHLQVENLSIYHSYESLQRMFEQGYTTKGEGRGLGLNSLKCIVDKYKGELLVENISEAECNWFKISITI